MTNYILEIYKPNNAYDPLATLKSDTPFQAIHQGDLIDPRVYDLADEGDLVSQLLCVVSVKHVITQSGDLTATRHHISVFTKAVPNEETTVLSST